MHQILLNFKFYTRENMLKPKENCDFKTCHLFSSAANMRERHLIQLMQR